MLRLNTWYFDESIVFAGKGAERNNMLIDCFLEDEKDNRMFYKLNLLEPKEFQVKADSLLDTKLKTFDEYIAKNQNETPGFKHILKTALTYPIYAKKERYPVAHSKVSNQAILKILIKVFTTIENLFVLITTPSCISHRIQSMWATTYTISLSS